MTTGGFSDWSICESQCDNVSVDWYIALIGDYICVARHNIV
jgi:hypothetical protein